MRFLRLRTKGRRSENPMRRVKTFFVIALCIESSVHHAKYTGLSIINRHGGCLGGVTNWISFVAAAVVVGLPSQCKAEAHK